MCLDELVEPSYLRIVAVKDGIPEDTDETKRIINNCGIGSIIVERVVRDKNLSFTRIFYL